MAKSLFVNSRLLIISDNTTTYVSLQGETVANTTEANLEIPIRKAGSFNNLYVYVSASSASNTTTFTLRKSRADTAVTISIAGDTTGIFENTTNSVTFAATDEATYKIVVPTESGSNSITFQIMKVEFTPDADTVTVLAATGVSTALTSASTVRYHPLGGGLATDINEYDINHKIGGVFTASNLYVYVTANARTTNTVFVSSKTGIDGNLIVTYGNVETGVKEDTTNTDSISSGAVYCLKSTTGTGTQTLTFWVASATLVSTAGQFLFVSANASSQNSALTRYASIGGQLILNATEANTQIYPRTTFTAKQLSASSDANTLNGSTVITLRDNGADSSVTITFGTSETGAKTDTTNSTIITAATDEINHGIVTAGSSGTITLNSISLIGEISTGYTMAAALGTFNETGNNVNLLYDHKLLGELGTFVIGGNTVNFNKGIIFVLSNGTFNVIGIDSGLIATRLVRSNAGVFILTGNQVVLTPGVVFTPVNGVRFSVENMSSIYSFSDQLKNVVVSGETLIPK